VWYLYFFKLIPLLYKMSQFGKLVTEDFDYQRSSIPQTEQWTTTGFIYDTNVANVVGTPNTTSGGPGVGSGGETGKVGENTTYLGRGLTTNVTLDPENPVVGAGIYTVDFRQSVTAVSCTIVNARGVVVDLIRDGNTVRTYVTGDLGPNSVWTIQFRSFCVDVGYEGIDSIRITQTESVLTQLTYYYPQVESSLPTETVDRNTFLSQSEDFSGPNINRKSFRDFTTDAFVFDTTAPGLGDEEYGTPHVDFAGPGIGSGGATDKPGENSVNLGNALIIPTGPNPSPATGTITLTFRRLVYFQSITILGSDDPGNKITLKDDGGSTLIEKLVGDYGENSTVQIPLPGYRVRSVEVLGLNPIAITNITYDIPQWRSPTILHLAKNSAGPVDIPIGTTGSFLLRIESDEGASAVIAIASGSITQAGSINKLTSTPSPTLETITVLWPGNSNPQLTHDTLSANTDLAEYTIWYKN
jgi:hypothetical protein